MNFGGRKLLSFGYDLLKLRRMVAVEGQVYACTKRSIYSR